MNGILCGPSAFKFYRTPPWVLRQCEPSNAAKTAPRSLMDWRKVLEPITNGARLHLLVTEKNHRTNIDSVQHHLWTGETPSNFIQDNGVFGQITSPLGTLFTLGRMLSEYQLIMAMYEMCGTFTVYKPTAELEESTWRKRENTSELALGDWRCVYGSDGRPSSLWSRPPLITLPELLRFAEKMKRRRGGATFLRAAKAVTGVTASPFEAQASMLLGLPRNDGGCGLAIDNNAPLRLNRQASSVAHKRTCYADLLICSPNGKRRVDLECQGALVHTGTGAEISDADRTTALSSMGVDVILASHAQIRNMDSFNVLVKLIMRKLDEPYRPKTTRQIQKERDLRRAIFTDWLALGEDALN